MRHRHLTRLPPPPADETPATARGRNATACPTKSNRAAAEEQRPPAEEAPPPSDEQQPPSDECRRRRAGDTAVSASKSAVTQASQEADEAHRHQARQRHLLKRHAATVSAAALWWYASTSYREGKTPDPRRPRPKQIGAEIASAPPLAVVIAIDDYDNAKLTGSPQAIANAAHLVRFLKGDLGLDDTRIITGRNADRSDFEEIFGKPGDTKGELRDILEDTKASEVIVYFAGRAQALDGGKDVLLLPSDADPGKPETGIRLSALYDALAAMRIPKLRLYLDASFTSGKEVVTVDAGPNIGFLGLFTPGGWVTVSAASDTVEAGDADRARSLFIESLVAGLRGIADTTGDGDGDGTVSAGELYGFARDQAAAAVKRGGKEAVPSLYGPPEETLRTY